MRADFKTASGRLSARSLSAVDIRDCLASKRWWQSRGLYLKVWRAWGQTSGPWPKACLWHQEKNAHGFVGSTCRHVLGAVSRVRGGHFNCLVRRSRCLVVHVLSTLPILYAAHSRCCCRPLAALEVITDFEVFAPAENLVTATRCRNWTVAGARWETRILRTFSYAGARVGSRCGKFADRKQWSRHWSCLWKNSFGDTVEVQLYGVLSPTSLEPHPIMHLQASSRRRREPMSTILAIVTARVWANRPCKLTSFFEGGSEFSLFFVAPTPQQWSHRRGSILSRARPAREQHR